MSTKRLTSRRGAIFVTAMWVTIIIGAVVLVFARSMRVELIASANRVSADQAEAIELGVEQYVLAAVDNIDGEAEYVLSLPGEQCKLGDGYFWLLRPSANQQNYEFGITDEASKLNINTAATRPSTNGSTPAAQLMLLPGITNQQADSIVDWIDTDTQNVTNGDGAESPFYEGLPEPYDAKNANLETLEELNLIQGIGPGFQGGPDLLYGIDRNHNGVIEPGEMAQGSTGTNSFGETADRGIFPFITIYSQEPDVDLQGNPRINCRGTTTGGGGGGGGNIATQLTNAGVQSNIAQRIATAVQQASGNQGNQNNQTSRTQTVQNNQGITSIFMLAQRAGLSSQDLATVADKLSFVNPRGSATTGLINVNTAPREVLMTLTALTTVTQNDIDNLVNERSRADLSTIMWVSQALTPEKATEIGPYITSRSFVYSADIVAVSGDGRAFKRVRIVVDATKSPAKIIYRRDLTSLGWPLPEEVRTSLRQGRGPGPSLSGGNNGMGGMGGMGLGR